MKNQVAEEARFITKECAGMLEGKTPSPYLRLHDPVQRAFAQHAAAQRGQPLRETAYFDRMIHFWREVSLLGLPRTGIWMDDCYALLFEAAFDLAEAEPGWALECLDQKTRGQWPWEPLSKLARYTAGRDMSHQSIIKGFAAIYAPHREQDDDWKDGHCVVASGNIWFWTALLASAGVTEDHSLWAFRCALASSSQDRWGDQKLHTRLIREAPVRAEVTPKMQLMNHPLIRIARLKYKDGSIEQNLVDRFLNHRCIVEGFESEENCFSSDVTLAQWVRDARAWATELLHEEPETCAELFEASGSKAIEAVRQLFHAEVGLCPAQVDDLDATASLMLWAKKRRGFPFSSYRAQMWEFVIEIVNAALWLGWLFPRLSG